MGIRRFGVTVTCTMEVEVDDRVLAQVDDMWRKTFYPDVKSELDTVEFVVKNLVHHGVSLHQVEGFGDLPDRCVEILDEEWESTAKELK
jgi:hypothetical protein